MLCFGVILSIVLPDYEISFCAPVSNSGSTTERPHTHTTHTRGEVPTSQVGTWRRVSQVRQRQQLQLHYGR